MCRKQTESMPLASPIGRITERTQQQGHVIMLCRITNRESYRDFAIKPFDSQGCKIGFGIKHQTVNAAMQRKTRWQQILCATIPVGRSSPDLLPTAVGSFEFQPDRNAAGRLATGGVENVCGDSTHGLRSFSNLRRVILRCSSAALRNSVSASFFSRAFRIFSISSEDFPVAQTM